MKNNDYLLYLLIEDLKHLTKEIVALRFELIDKYPHLRYELLSDLTPFVRSSEEYHQLIETLHYDFFEDDKDYLEELQILRKTGKSKNHPFSI